MYQFFIYIYYYINKLKNQQGTVKLFFQLNIKIFHEDLVNAYQIDFMNDNFLFLD